MQLTDNVAVDWLKSFIDWYVYSMKQLMVNTFTELYQEVSEMWSSLSSVISHDMLVLATAFCDIFGLLISLGVIYTVVKVVCWICFDQPTGEHSEYLLKCC